jgi:hypothetical protein
MVIYMDRNKYINMDIDTGHGHGTPAMDVDTGHGHGHIHGHYNIRSSTVNNLEE